MGTQKRHVYSINPETGKLTRRKRSSNEPTLTKTTDDFLEVVRPAECPYQIEEPDVLKELTSPFKTVKLSCNLDIELSLSAAFNRHKHEIVTDIDKSKFPNVTDFSSWEYDPGSFVCGLFFEIRPRVAASIPRIEIHEDKKIRQRLKEASKKAEKVSSDLQEISESKNSEKRLKNFVELLARTEEHLQKHLKSEIERVAERLAFEIHTLGERGEDRDKNLRLFLEEEEVALRKRLPTPKGRVPNRKRRDFEDVKSDFLEDAVNVLSSLKSNGLKINKSQLAKKMFRSDNPLLLLNRKLKEFDLTFVQIVNEYETQNVEMLTNE